MFLQKSDVFCSFFDTRARAGKYAYTDMDTLIEVCVTHMQSEQFPAAQVRAYMKELLPTLDYWKRQN